MFQRTPCCTSGGPSTSTSERSQKPSNQARCWPVILSTPASSARSRVRRQRLTSSRTGTPREVWYAAYFTSRIGTPARACTR